MSALRCTQCQAGFAHVAYPAGAVLQCPHCGGRVAVEQPTDSPVYHARQAAASTLVWAIGGMTLCVVAVAAVIWLYLSGTRMVTLVAPDGNTERIIVQVDPATPAGKRQLADADEVVRPTAPPIRSKAQAPPTPTKPREELPAKPPARARDPLNPLAQIEDDGLKSQLARLLAEVNRRREYDPDSAQLKLHEMQALADGASLAADVRANLAALVSREAAATGEASAQIALSREAIHRAYPDLFAAKPLQPGGNSARQLAALASGLDKLQQQAAYFLEARHLAIAAGDLNALEEIAGLVANRFTLNRQKLVAEWFELASAELLRNPESDPGANARLARGAMKQSALHASAREYEAALATLDLAERHAARASSAPLNDSLREQRANLTIERGEYQQAAPALKTLETAPNDPAANLVAGRYLCFIQGDWRTGLPRLALGSDPRLAGLARQDLGFTTGDRAQRVVVGDAWWDLSEELFPLAQKNVQERAKSWYSGVGPLSPPVAQRVAQRLEKLVSPDNPLAGRTGKARAELLALYGGNNQSEEAVRDALAWLLRVQDPLNGGWTLKGDGRYSAGATHENRSAATAMALLALLGAGHTPSQGAHAPAVTKGVRFLLAQQKHDGCLFVEGTHNADFYTHALATIALCELTILTQDGATREAAKKAVAYCVKTQNRLGGWRYTVGADGTSTESDLSVTSWIGMALHTAKKAQLEVPRDTLSRLSMYLEKVQSQGGSRYGYTGPSDKSPGMTAAGLVCRQQLGWEQNDQRMVAGADFVVTQLPNWNERDVYSWYHATRLLHNLQGERWTTWNNTLRNLLIARQQPTGPERGSWIPTGDKWGNEGGRLFVTCFSTYILETYYRYLPLYAEQTP